MSVIPDTLITLGSGLIFLFFSKSDLTPFSKRQRAGLIGRISLVHKTEVIDSSINRFCETAQVRLSECKDFQTKRQFLVDYVEKIIFLNDKVSLFGSVPIITKGRADEFELTTKIDFKIDGRVKRPSI